MYDISESQLQTAVRLVEKNLRKLAVRVIMRTLFFENSLIQNAILIYNFEHSLGTRTPKRTRICRWSPSARLHHNFPWRSHERCCLRPGIRIRRCELPHWVLQKTGFSRRPEHYPCEQHVDHSRVKVYRGTQEQVRLLVINQLNTPYQRALSYRTPREPSALPPINWTRSCSMDSTRYCGQGCRTHEIREAAAGEAKEGGARVRSEPVTVLTSRWDLETCSRWRDQCQWHWCSDVGWIGTSLRIQWSVRDCASERFRSQGLLPKIRSRSD